MTIDTVPAAAVPSVFDAGLPSLDYLRAQDPEDAHRAIADARRQAPIALGAVGPEVRPTTWSARVARPAVRRRPTARRRSPGHHIRAAVATDHRFDSVDRRGAPSPTASPGREGVHAPRRARLQKLIVEIITELIDAHVPVGRCDVVCDVAEQFPTPVICALRALPASDWKLFSDWSTDIKKIFDWNLAADEAASSTPGRPSTTTRGHDRPPAP